MQDFPGNCANDDDDDDDENNNSIEDQKPYLLFNFGRTGRILELQQV